MAAPFFSRQIPGGAAEDLEPEGLTEIEIYHILMLAYPGYTIQCIEDELSWRQVNELMACWQKDPPPFHTERRIMGMLEKMGGFKRLSYKPLGGDKLEERLKGMGWL